MGELVHWVYTLMTLVLLHDAYHVQLCYINVAVYFLFSIRSVNVAITLLSPLDNMSTLSLVLVQDEFRHASTVTPLIAPPHANSS